MGSSRCFGFTFGAVISSIFSYSLSINRALKRASQTCYSSWVCSLTRWNHYSGVMFLGWHTSLKKKIVNTFSKETQTCDDHFQMSCVSVCVISHVAVMITRLIYLSKWSQDDEYCWILNWQEMECDHLSDEKQQQKKPALKHLWWHST